MTQLPPPPKNDSSSNVEPLKTQPTPIEAFAQLRPASDPQKASITFILETLATKSVFSLASPILFRDLSKRGEELEQQLPTICFIECIYTDAILRGHLSALPKRSVPGLWSQFVSNTAKGIRKRSKESNYLLEWEGFAQKYNLDSAFILEKIRSNKIDALLKYLSIK